MSAKLTIVFSGMVAADPHQGGATWAILQYLLGFRDLGHEVYLIEPVRRKSLRPHGPLGESDNARYFHAVAEEYGLAGRSALLVEGTTETTGLSYEELQEVARRADVLFNVSGMLTDERLLAPIVRRVYLDLDPAFIQLWASEYGIDMRFAAHERFVTIGHGLGEAGCPIPTCGLDWIKTEQPIALSQWPVANEIEHQAFTSVGNWRAYGSAERAGVFYGQKAHSTREIIDLPLKTSEKIALALAIHPGDEKDVAALRSNGWQLLDPAETVASPSGYRRFIQGSKAELGIAKSGYVKSSCGWFSDRSICYLASGRPVVAQETGFSGRLPVGEGLFAFSTTDEAVEAIAEIGRDYDKHRAAARSIAEDIFDSRKVLPRLLEEALS